MGAERRLEALTSLPPRPEREWGSGCNALWSSLTGLAAGLLGGRLHPLVAALVLCATPLQVGSAWAQPATVASVRLPQLATLPGEPGRYRLRLHVAVLDAAGRPVAGLDQDAFALEIDGQRRAPTSVQAFAATGEGITMLLAVDTSHSMRRTLGAVRVALKGLLQRMRAPDRMAVARMGERYAMVQAFTGESALLEKAIESLKPVDRATGLFEGVYKGSDALWSHPAPPHRKMLLLFSDGGNDKAGFSQEQAEQRARERFVDVHVLHYSGGRRKLREREVEREAGLLEGLAYKTSGGYHRLPQLSELDRRFQDLSGRVYSEHVLEYTGPETVYDGQRHAVTVTVRGVRSLDDRLSFQAPAAPTERQASVPGPGTDSGPPAGGTPPGPAKRTEDLGGAAPGSPSGAELAEPRADDEHGLSVWIPIGLGVGALLILLLLVSDRRSKRRRNEEALNAALSGPSASGRGPDGSSAGSGQDGSPDSTAGAGADSEMDSAQGSARLRVPTEAVDDGPPQPAAGASGSEAQAVAGQDEPEAAAVGGARFVVEGLDLLFPLDRDEVHIGQDVGNDICLPEERVSGFHATVCRRGGRRVLQDRNSTNGTLLNDELIEAWQDHPLSSGDRVRIGPYVLRYEE